MKGPILNGKTLLKASVPVVIQLGKEVKKNVQLNYMAALLKQYSSYYILSRIKIQSDLRSLHAMKKAHQNELSHRERN